MPNFVYKAKSGPQKIVTGVISADDESQALAKILQLGQTPLEIKPQVLEVPLEQLIPSTSSRNSLKVSLATVAVFTRQMVDMLDAGVPLLRCLEVIMNQKQKNPSLQTIISELHQFVREGGSFSDALAQHPRTFPLLFVNMVKSGELSGDLPRILNRLADFIDKDLQMQSQVKGSLIYPGIIFLVGLMTMFILLTFVLPKLTVMFEDFDAALPLPTQIVIAVSSFFSKFWWLIIALVAGVGFYFKQWIQTAHGQERLENFVMKVPILKQFIQASQMARFSRTMGTLLESGVRITSALESVTAMIDNALFKKEMKEITQKVKEGASLTTVLKNSRFFSEVAISLIAVGEESGKLEKGLYKLAIMCERSTLEKAQIFVTILGPAVLVVVVAIVGFVIIAMLLPMFRMNMIIN